MNKLSILFILLIPIAALAQTSKGKETNSRANLVWESNLPDDLHDFYNEEKIRTTYGINKDLNPFYLRGDFDGDKKIDYALAVIELKTEKKGILIYHPAIKGFFVVGAGIAILNRLGDDYQWMNAWLVYGKKEVGLGVGETEKIKLIGEAILIQKLESSSGLIYWDGKQYKWYQQGD